MDSSGLPSRLETPDAPAVDSSDVLDSLTAHIAVLDAEGSILTVNEGWRRFALENGGDADRCSVGANYLSTCEEAVRRGGDGAAEAVARGLRAVLQGVSLSFSAEYPCHSPAVERWFVVRATACRRHDHARVVVAHEDVTARRRAENVLRETEQTLRGVLDALPVGVWIMDHTGRIVLGNPAGQRIWRGARYVGPDQFGEYKGWWLDTGEPIAPDDWAAARAISRGETSLDEEIEIECFDGTRKLILNSAIPLLDARGQVSGAIIVNQDVTARKQAEAALRASEEKWRTLFTILPVGVAILDEERRIVEMNAELEKATATSREDLAAGTYRKRRYLRADGTPLGPDEFPSAQAIREQRVVHGMEIGTVKEDGEMLWASVSAAPLPLPDTRAVVVTTDITHQKQVELALREANEESDAANAALQEVLEQEKVLARTDVLTGVANRRYFFDLASQQFAVAQRYARSLSVVLFDVDRFKRVNDELGHHVGDQVLKDVARAAAREHLRHADTFARYGGEEFVLLLPDSDAKQAMVVAERIRAAIAAQATETDKGPVSVTVSAGIATILPGDDALERLLQRADQALYAAKAAGRNRAVIFTSSDANGLTPGEGARVSSSTG